MLVQLRSICVWDCPRFPIHGHHSILKWRSGLDLATAGKHTILQHLPPLYFLLTSQELQLIRIYLCYPHPIDCQKPNLDIFPLHWISLGTFNTLQGRGALTGLHKGKEVLVFGKINLAGFLIGWWDFPRSLKPCSEMGIYFAYSQCWSYHFML